MKFIFGMVDGNFAVFDLAAGSVEMLVATNVILIMIIEMTKYANIQFF